MTNRSWLPRPVYVVTINGDNYSGVSTGSALDTITLQARSILYCICQERDMVVHGNLGPRNATLISSKKTTANTLGEPWDIFKDHLSLRASFL